MDTSDKILIGGLIFGIILIILAFLDYNNKTELERCMDKYGDYNYCQRYEDNFEKEDK